MPEKPVPSKNGDDRQPINRVENVDSPQSDPFDPEALRLEQDFTASVGVKKVITTVPCKKPNRHEFVRVRPGDGWRLETATFEDKTNRDTYLVDPALRTELVGDISPVCLFLTVNRQGDIFFWPAKLPSDARSNQWHESALEAAALAESKWIRIAANMSAGLYDIFEAAGELSEPDWAKVTSDLPFRDLLEKCFKGRFLHSPDHPILRSLRGEV